MRAAQASSAALSRCSALTAARRGCYWAIGVSGRTQPYARGDLIPKLHITGGVANATSNSALLTGSNQHIAYDTDNIFNPTGFLPAEKDHFRSSCRALSRWAVPELPDGAAQSTSDLFLRMESSNQTSLWFDSFFKDFPSALKAFEGNSLAAELTSFFRSVIAVSRDEEAVAALAKPFIMEKMEKNFVSIPMWWRIAEHLMTALEGMRETRYDKINARVVIERVMKIAMNTLADQPWAHEELMNSKTVQLVGDRVMHEGGLW